MHISMATCHYLQLYLWVSFSDHGGGVVKMELHLLKKKKIIIEIKKYVTTTATAPFLWSGLGLRCVSAKRGPPAAAIPCAGAPAYPLQLPSLLLTLLKIVTFRAI